MVGCYPRQPHAPEIYLEGLRHLADEGCYTPPMVARACALVAQNSKYLPAPAEFRQELEKAKWPGIAPRELERGRELRIQAEAALSEAKGLGFRL
jgi:hypothetical protein